jgi:hypothetical protein
MRLNNRESPHSVFLGVPTVLAFKTENFELQVCDLSINICCLILFIATITSLATRAT